MGSWKASVIAVALTCFAISLLPGCGTLKDGRGWGQDAIVPLPSGERIGRSALRAALDPMTWVPAIGASLFAIDGWDRKVSDWAIENTPIFGSPSSASDASDYLLWGTLATAGVTTFATPSGDDAGGWLLSKTKGLAVEAAGVGVSAGVTEVLKGAVGRERPSGNSQTGFPSSHSTNAFSLATLASKDLDSIAMPAGARIGLQAGAYSIATGTAWARVEAGRHFPSDVLAGAAIGHFLTAFIHDAFLGLPIDDSVSLEVEPVDRGAMVSVGVSF